MPTNEDDFAAWLLEQATWLRQGQFSQLDAVRLADEIEGLAADQMELIGNGLTTILKHMLKRDYLPQGSRDNWAGEVNFQQTYVTRALMRSPIYGRLLFCKMILECRHERGNDCGHIFGL